MSQTKSEIILDQYKKNEGMYNSLCNTVSRIIGELLSMEKISYSSICGRVKTEKSLTKKVETKGDKYNHIDDITDIVGVRIITYYSDDVDKIANLIEREFQIDIENSIDKREALDPDKFGYLSIHYICQMSNKRLELLEYSNLRGKKFEIQIRSILQHTWAEIEHDLGYKSKEVIPRDIRRNFSRLAGLLEIADEEFKQIRDKLSKYKIDIEKQFKENKNKDILIDKVSIKVFIDTSEEMKELNNKIAEAVNASLETSCDLGLPGYLLSLNVTTIDELNNMLKSNSELAYQLAIKYLKGASGKRLVSGVGILYLCYAELLLKKYSDDEIREFFKKNIYGSRYEDGLTKLKSYYKEIQIENEIIKK